MSVIAPTADAIAGVDQVAPRPINPPDLVRQIARRYYT